MNNFLSKFGRWLRDDPSEGFPAPLTDGPLPPPRYVRRSIVALFLDARTRYSAAWVLALVMAGFASYYAWYDFYKPNRPDQTDGHRAIDFGGQYLMGRMLQQGYGKELYFRERQRQVLEGAYHDDKDPDDSKTDVEHLMEFTMGDDQSTGTRNETECRILERVGEDAAINPPHIGGPLYPPINAFLSYPLAWMRPVVAFRVNQGLNLLLAFLAGLAASFLSRGRLWWPIATCFVFIFPGFAGTFCLGQNATLTLNILLWGWLLISRDQPLAGGMTWGLLAFKPVWLLSFLLVPLLMRRWRVALAMLSTAAVLAVATLPFVGVHSWLDWLRIGREAAVLYDTDENWIFMSRDLYSIPRRWILHFEPGQDRIPDPAPGWVRLFQKPASDWDDPLPWRWDKIPLRWDQRLSAAFPLLALAGTITVAWLRRARVGRATDGPAAAFVLLGAWMSCFHFMYYDVLLAALPVCLLFTDPRRFLEPLFVGLWPFGKATASAELADYYRPDRFFHRRLWLPYVQGGYGQLFLINSFVLTLVAFLLSIQYVFPHIGIGVYRGPPSDTYVLIVLWLWCGFRLLVDKDETRAAQEEPTQSEEQLREDKEPVPPSEPWDDAWIKQAESERTGIRANPGPMKTKEGGDPKIAAPSLPSYPDSGE